MVVIHQNPLLHLRVENRLALLLTLLPEQRPVGRYYPPAKPRRGGRRNRSNRSLTRRSLSARRASCGTEEGDKITDKRKDDGEGSCACREFDSNNVDGSIAYPALPGLINVVGHKHFTGGSLVSWVSTISNRSHLASEQSHGGRGVFTVVVPVGVMTMVTV